MTTEPKSHGVDPTPEITAKDNTGAFSAPPAPPASTPAAPPAQGGPYRPQGLAEHLAGASDQETIDRLFNAYTGARSEIAKGKPAIPAPEAYTFNWSDAVKGQGGIASDDQAVKAFATIANEHGYTQQQIDAIPKFFDMMIDKGIIEKPFDSAGLLEELAPTGYKGSPAEKQAKGGERLAQAETWIKQLDGGRGFDDQMKQELRLLTMSAPGVRVVEQLMRSGMVQSVSPGGGAAMPGGVTKEMLDARTADPRNDSTRHDKYDPAFAEETRRMFRQLYPS